MRVKIIENNNLNEDLVTIECKEITADVTKTYIYSGSEIVFEYSLSQDISVTVNIPDSMINVDDYDYSIISNDYHLKKIILQLSFRNTLFS